jgi:transcriptional regulator with XRE-family HTH domain
MTSRRKPSKRRRGEWYLALQFWELESPAFKALSADATRVYLFMRKRLSFDNSNNGHVPFSHRDATEILHAGGWRRGSNALAELMHYGFTKLRNGGELGANVRLASEWQLTACPCGGQEPSKDFMRWDGVAFDSPYAGRLGRHREQAEKQPPIFTVKTRHLHSEDAYPESERLKPRPNGETVFTVKTPQRGRHLHREDTNTVTTQGGAKAAQPQITLESENSARAQKRRPRNSGTAWPAAERQKLGLTQPELAHRAGIQREYLSIIEQGRREPGADIRARLEAALHDQVKPPAPPRPPTRPADDASYAKRGARIRAARKALGMSGKDVAAIAGVLPQVVSAAERGRLNKSGGPVCGRPAYSKLEAALGLDGLDNEETQGDRS